MRHIGTDLHQTNFVVCSLSADETTRTETYPLTEPGLARFIISVCSRPPSLCRGGFVPRPPSVEARGPSPSALR